MTNRKLHMLPIGTKVNSWMTLKFWTAISSNFLGILCYFTCESE